MTHIGAGTQDGASANYSGGELLDRCRWVTVERVLQLGHREIECVQQCVGTAAKAPESTESPPT